MFASAITLAKNPISIFPEYRSRAWWGCFITAVVLMVLVASVSVYAAGWGGYISEKVVDRSGVNNSNLLIGRSGVGVSDLDVVMSGIVAAAGATNIFMDGAGTHATLHGNLQNLNGFPQATVYFQWGYDTSYGHVSTSQVVVATGAFTADIQGFDPSQTIYYRAVVDTDGINYSSADSFVAEGAIVTGFNLLNATVVFLYVVMIILAVVAIGSQSTVVALLFMVVAIYLGEAFVVVIQEAIRNIFGG